MVDDITLPNLKNQSITFTISTPLPTLVLYALLVKSITLSNVLETPLATSVPCSIIHCLQHMPLDKIVVLSPPLHAFKVRICVLMPITTSHYGLTASLFGTGGTVTSQFFDSGLFPKNHMLSLNDFTDLAGLGGGCRGNSPRAPLGL